MLPLLLALAAAAAPEPDAQVSWDIVEGRIENCRVTRSTGDPKLDGKVCAAVACARKADVRTAKGELLPYRPAECERKAALPKKKR